MKLKNLTTKVLGKNEIYYKTIDSTQDEAWRLIESGKETGTIIITDIQQNGKGTHGRTWYTDTENNVAFSFFLKLDCNIQKIHNITYEIANTIIYVLEKQYNVKLQIKEPNDIVFCNKKIGGILTQTKIFKENVKYIVIGIGLNTNKEEFNKEIRNIATSIKKEFGVTINNYDFISEFCNQFEKLLLEKGVLDFKSKIE